MYFLRNLIVVLGNLIVASNRPTMNVGMGRSSNFPGKRCLIGPARGLRSKICLGPVWLQPSRFAHLINLIHEMSNVGFEEMHDNG